MKIFFFFFLTSLISSLSLLPTPIEIKSINIQESNIILNKWMSSISKSSYLINNSINNNQYKLTPIIKGLIMTTETSINDILPEQILCYSVKKDNQNISIVICVLINYVLFLDTICFNPKIEEDKEYFKTIIDHCKIVSKYDNYTLNLSRLSDKQLLEYIYNF